MKKIIFLSAALLILALSSQNVLAESEYDLQVVEKHSSLAKKILKMSDENIAKSRYYFGLIDLNSQGLLKLIAGIQEDQPKDDQDEENSSFENYFQSTQKTIKSIKLYR